MIEKQTEEEFKQEAGEEAVEHLFNSENEATATPDNPNLEVEEIAMNDLLAPTSDYVLHDKEAGEVDLYNDVEESLRNNGLDEYDWTKGLVDHDWLKTKPMSQQRLVVNRALRMDLSEYDNLENDQGDTRIERMNLLDAGSYEDWKKYLNKVTPCIAKRQQGLDPYAEDESSED